MKTLTTLALGALLLTGCVTVVAPLPSSPVPTGTALSLPTAVPAQSDSPQAGTPTPRPPTSAPQVYDDGTPWMTFLGWAMAATEEMLPVWERGETDVFGSAQAGLPIVRSHLGWLNTHPPMACYATLHAAMLYQYGRAEAAFTAIDTGDFGNAVGLMQAALDATTRVNELVPTTGCSA